LAATALVLALVAVAFLLFFPLTSTESLEVGVDPVTGEQQEVRRSGSDTLLEHEGASVLPVLAVPALLTGLGVAAARRSSRRLLTLVVVAYGIGVLLAMASIGVFFLPSLLAIVLARWRSGAVVPTP
jgi:amino acid transporter